MQLHDTTSAVEATVALELRVPRGEPGGLTDGVVAVLERVAGVRAVTVDHVHTVRPSPADLYVTATVDLAFALDLDRDDERTVRTTLTDGFGVIDVESVTFRRETPP